MWLYGTMTRLGVRSLLAVVAVTAAWVLPAVPAQAQDSSVLAGGGRSAAGLWGISADRKGRDLCLLLNSGPARTQTCYDEPPAKVALVVSAADRTCGDSFAFGIYRAPVKRVFVRFSGEGAGVSRAKLLAVPPPFATKGWRIFAAWARGQSTVERVRGVDRRGRTASVAKFGSRDDVPFPPCPVPPVSGAVAGR